MKQSDWIAVKDRLPEGAALVTDGIHIDVSFCDLTYCGDDPNEREWFNRIYPGSFKEITHWMPLPPVPEAKCNENEWVGQEECDIDCGAK